MSDSRFGICASSSTSNVMEQIIAREPKPERLIRSKIEFECPPAGTNMARELIGAFRANSRKVLLVDTPSRRQWTGAQLLDTCGRIATNLINMVQVKPDDIVMTICEHTGVEILAALGAVLAGGALFGTSPQDGYSEMKVLCELAAPNVIIASSKQHEVAVALRENLESLRDVKIVWLDNPMKHCDSGINVAGDSGEDSNDSTASAHNNSDSDNNNNNNNNDTSTPDLNNNNKGQQSPPTSHPIELIIERDQVVLFEDLLNGPLDMELVDSMANERIEPKTQVLTYMLTSGSTGRPKVVPSTHEELVYGLYSMISACRRKINGCHLLPVSPDAVVSGDLPLDHGAGLNTMFLALYLGAKYVVMPSYDVDCFWQGVSDYKITSSISSTTFAYKLFARLKKLIDSNETNKWDLGSLRYILCAGAKLASIELVREVQRVYRHMHISQTYGCTEIGFISIVPANESLSDLYLSSTGYLMPGLLAKVVAHETTSSPSNADQDHHQQRRQQKERETADCSQLDDNEHEQRPLGPMERGELLVWAQSKFKGYKCHPSDNCEAIYANCHDELGVFYKTGDKVHCDHDGRIYIHGRFKDTLTLMEDWKILPAELEEVINEHPLVELSAVVGVDDPELPGCHKPRAFCKLISAAEPAADESVASDQLLATLIGDRELSARLAARDFEFICRHIYAFVAQRTARPKHLTGGVRIVDELPRVGLLNKIDRKALHRMD